jgi:hypothetical protein
MVAKKVGKSSRVSRKAGGTNGAYVGGWSLHDTRGDGKWSRSRLLQWVGHIATMLN